MSGIRYPRLLPFVSLLFQLIPLPGLHAEPFQEVTPYRLTLDENYQLTRSGSIGERLTWVITSEGDTLLSRNAANELNYTYFRNLEGKEYSCYLETWSVNRYIRVSNIVAYRVGVEYHGPIITSKPSILTKAGEEIEDYQITATNFPTSFSASGLPPGLTLSETGIIHGTPTSAGKFLVTLQAGNGIDTGSATLDITIASGDNGGGHADNFTISIDDKYRITRTSGSPASLSWVIRKNGTQVLARNALSETHYTYFANFGGAFTVHLQSLINGKQERVSNIISYIPGSPISNLVIFSPSAASGIIGKPFTPYLISATGNSTSFSAGGLPSGLQIDASGEISGIPRETGRFPVTISVANESGTASKQIIVTISSDIDTPASLEDQFTLTLAEDLTVTRTGGETSALTWIVKRNGVTVLERNAANEIGYRYYANTPNQTYTIHLNAWFNGTYQRVSNIVAYRPGSGFHSSLPVISNPPAWLITANKPVVPFRITASNNPTLYSAQSLPPGLLIDGATGLISGTPTATGNHSTLIAAANTFGTARALLNIIVKSPATSDPASLYSLHLSDSLVISRSGGNHPQLKWVVLKDGAVVLKRLAHSDTNFHYYRNFLPGDYVCHLEAFLDGRTQIVSNSVGYRTGDSQPTIQSVLKNSRNVVCTLGRPCEVRLQASGNIAGISATGLPPGLSISPDGLVSGSPSVLGEYVASVNLTHSAGTSSTSMKFTVHPPQTGRENYLLSLGDDFSVIRSNGDESALQWVVSHNGRIILKRNADGEIQYTYHRNYIAGSYSIHLEAWRGDRYQIVSNILNYETTPLQESGSGRKLLLAHALGETSGVRNNHVEPDFQVTRNAEDELVATYEYTANKALEEDGFEIIVEYSLDTVTWKPASCSRTILGEDDRVEHRLDKLQTESAPSALFRLKVQPFVATK